MGLPGGGSQGRAGQLVEQWGEESEGAGGLGCIFGQGQLRHDGRGCSVVGRVWVVCCCVWCRRWWHVCGVESVWWEDDGVILVPLRVDQYPAEKHLVE